MITLILQTNNSPKQAVDKDLTVLEQVQATLKEQTNIEEPVFVIQGGLPRYLTQCNYITSPELSRQYFIDDVVSVAANLVEVHCLEDYRGTWRTYIREQTAIIRRQETPDYYNTNLSDPAIKTYKTPHIYTKSFGASAAPSPCYVLTLAGLSGAF